jgi:hypothetical protein
MREDVVLTVKKCKWIVFFIGMLPAVLFAQTNGILNDAVIIPPNYDTFSPPAQVGGTYLDPVFGTRVQRITNCGRFNQDCLGGYFGNSEICYFNCDGSYFIAAENEIINDKNLIGTFLYNGVTGSRIKLLGLYGETIQPYLLRWALANQYKTNGRYQAFDPVYSFYLIAGNELRMYDVRSTDRFVVLHKFDEYKVIGPAGGEGDVSDDGRFWCLDGDAKELFVYDLIDDIKYPVSTFDLGSLGSKGALVGVDYAAVSCKGTFIIVSWGTEAMMDGRYHGIEIYDKEWNFLRQVYPGVIHWELGVDAFGDEIILTVAPFGFDAYYKSFGINGGDIISIRLSDGRIRLLKHIPKWSHFCMSACNSAKDGSYFYMAYMTRSEKPDEMWYPYWGEILEVPTDGSGAIRRLLHHRTREVTGKTDKYIQPDLVVNRQGTKIIYRSVYLSRIGDIYMFDVGDRNNSGGDTTPPGPPTGLRTPIRTFDQLELQWDAPGQAPDGDYAVAYKIFRDNIHIGDCSDTRYRDTGLKEAASYKYDVYSIDHSGLQSVAPASALFSTLADTTRPVLDYVHIESQNKVILFFSEPLEPQSAQNVNNYRFDMDAQVIQAILEPERMAVVLQTSTLRIGTSYHLSVRNVTDVSARKNLVLPGTLKTIAIYGDFFDDFEKGITPAWDFLTPGRWNVVVDESDQSLFLDARDYKDNGDMLLGEYALINSVDLATTNFNMRVLAKSAENLNEKPDADYALIFDFLDSQNYSYIQFHPNDIGFVRIESGVNTIMEKFPFASFFNRYQQIEVQLQHDTLRVFVDDQRAVKSPYHVTLPGMVGLGSMNNAVYFDNVMIDLTEATDSVPPLEPTNLRLVMRTSTSLEIEWVPSLPAMDGEVAAYYKVYRNGQFVKNTTLIRFTDIGLDPKNIYQYKIYAVDDDGLKSINAAVGSFSTQIDTQPPHILNARSVNQSEMQLFFSEKLDKASAENPANYQINHDVQVVQATLGPDEMTVVLQVRQLLPGIDYILYVQNVSDNSGNKIESPTPVSFRLLPDFFDDFEHGLTKELHFLTPSRWSIVQDNTNHLLFLNTSDYESPDNLGLGEYALVSSARLTVRDFKLYCLVQSKEDPIYNRQADYAFIFGYKDNLNYCFVQFHPYNIGVNRIVDGARTLFQEYLCTIPFTQSQQVGLELFQDTLRVFIDEKLMVTQNLPDVPIGQIGFGSFNDSVVFDNFWVKDIAQSDHIPPVSPTGLELMLMKK